jgi:hypothetical protein
MPDATEARIAREVGLLRAEVARVCGRHVPVYTGTEAKRGRTGDVVVHWLEASLPGGLNLRLESTSSAKTRQNALRFFGAMPDGAMSIATKRAELVDAVKGGEHG